MRTTEQDAARAAWTRAAVPGGGALTHPGGAAPAMQPSRDAAGAVKAPPLDPDVEPGASLPRYARWQLRDFLRERGSWMLVLGALVIAPLRVTYEGDWREHARHLAWYGNASPTWAVDEPTYFRTQLLGRFALVGFVGLLLATHGLVSRDRERGYQRFLLAKPLRATRYYLQSFVVNGAGFLGVLALLLTCTAAAFVRGVPLLSGLAVAAGAYAAIGGLTLLLSTLVRWDVALATALTLAAGITSGLARVHGRWAPLWRALSWVLPPVDAIGQAMNALREGRTAGVFGALIPPFAYGAAYVAAGLAVIRRRSIAN